MKKFINHIDHITWISRPENMAANVAQLEQVSGVKLEPYGSEEMGFSMYLSWEAGMEIISPLPHRTPFNEALHARLEQQGEGVYAVVFGVDDLEAHRQRLEALGLPVGPLMENQPGTSWTEKVVVRERIGPDVMNTSFVLGQLDYREDVITYIDVE